MHKINCWIIYVLLLEDNCWYVGQTTSFAFKRRMNHHWTHATKGSQWTRRHKPTRIYSVDTYDRSLSISDMAKLEDKKTLEFAALYGFESVRGGGYCQAEPTWPIIKPVAKSKNPKKRNADGLTRKQVRAIERAKRELTATSKMLR